MGKFIRTVFFLAVTLFLAFPAWSEADDKAKPEGGIDQEQLARMLALVDQQDKGKTLSPFFFVGGGDAEVDQLPLKATRTQVRVAGVMAEVVVTQVYKNQGSKTLEAIYIFPASTRAAVHGLRMTIGKRVVEAEIMERKKARETYEKAKEEGQTATLLEQQRPNVFQMNVANILPGDEIMVELRYNELIVPEEGTYRFVYPAVVGPRYSNLPADTKDDKQNWVENPYLHEGQGAPYEFDLALDLLTGPPLAMLKSPSHEIEVEYSQKTRAHVRIKKDAKAGTKDFVLEYKLAGNKIEAGLLLHRGEKENHFLLMVEPPERVVPETILPREYVFVVDISGSMKGFPLDVSKELMGRIIAGLGPNEFMNVLLFAGGSSVLSENGSLPASQENKKKAEAFIQKAQGGGGTELLPALERALSLPKKEGLSRIIVVITDGFVSVEPEAIDLVKSNLGQANLFSFGIGSSVNRYLIEVLARVGRGEPQVVLNRAQALTKAEQFRRYIESPVLTDIKVGFQGFKAEQVEPEAVPDLFGLRPLILFGKYSGKPQGVITITGKTAAGDFKQEIKVVPEMESDQNKALGYLWARSRIAALSDLNNLQPDDKRIAEVTGLGLKYSLLTAYTSFVAVDKEIRADGKVVTVKQPLPLPEGVSDSAVGRGRHMLKAQMAPSPTTGGAVEQVRVPKGEGAAQEAADAEKALPRVKFTIKEAKGWPDQEKLVAALTEKQAEFDRCYRQARMHFRDLKGRLEFTFKVDSKGAASKINLLATGITDPGLIKCLSQALEAVVFPASAEEMGEVVLILDLVE